MVMTLWSRRWNERVNTVDHDHDFEPVVVE